MDVKHTTASGDDVGRSTDRNRSAPTASTFEIQELCSHIREQDIPQTNTLMDLDPRTRALIRPYMTIDSILTQTDGSQIHLYNDLLLDSGSLDGSYIGAATLQQYPKVIMDRQATTTKVYMADRKTHLPLSSRVLLDITIETPGEEKYNFVGWFGVLGEKHGIILGYPHILQMPRYVFNDRLEIARQKLSEHFRDLRSAKPIKVSGNRPQTQPRRIPHFTVQRLENARQWEYDFSGYGDIRDLPTHEQCCDTTELPYDYVDGDIYTAWQNEYDPGPEETLDLREEYSAFMEVGPKMALEQYLADLEKYKDLPPPKPGEERTAPLGLFSGNENFMTYMKEIGHKVFVPQNWDGINVDPIHLDVDDQLPKHHYARGRPPPKKLEAAARAELQRLLKYMYVRSKSPWVSDNVWAAKATAPYIRSCGDYRWINEHIKTQHAYIPNVQEELAKLRQFQYFCDFDLTNAFHQFKLDDATSELLSIMTIEGPIRPKFMPEGISPASSILQNHVREIFKDFKDDSLIMFDNLTIGANSLEELFEKQKKFFDTCIKHNIFLKFSKSYFGVTSIKFFGYIANGHGYKFEEARIDALLELPFPETGTDADKRKHMQRILGVANWLSSCYVHSPLHHTKDTKNNPLWADLIGPLADTTHKDFPWSNGSKWPRDYRNDLKRLKDHLHKVTTLYYPDYKLPWILRTDASTQGVGAILFQIRKNKEGVEIPEPIATVTHKFSATAQKWETIKQEGFAIFYAVKKLAPYLSGKDFLIETDHRNLVYMERSEVAILIRWRLFLQQFRFKIKHIKGVDNVVADTFSRLFPDDDEDNPQEKTETLILAHTQEEITEFENAGPEVSPKSKTKVAKYGYTARIPAYDKLIDNVHGHDNLHMGQRYTWRKLAMLHPGHFVPQQYVNYYVQQCAVCQKLREYNKLDTYKPRERTLKVDDPRKRIAIDAIYMKNPDANGNSRAHVIINHFTKLVFIYPCADLNARTAVKAILKYRALYGPIAEVQSLASDQGSDYMSGAIQQLNKWLSHQHRVALVGVHTSTGVEPFNKQIKRHIEALLIDRQENGHQWSDPEIIDLVAYAMNELPRTETAGHSAYELTFGDLSQLNGDVDSKDNYILGLQKNLAQIREKVAELNRHQIEKIERQPPVNEWQQNDLVFLKNEAQYCHGRRWIGPYQVLKQTSNEVKIQSLVDSDIVQEVHVTRLRAFHGDKADATRLARKDVDEYEIQEIVSYHGDPMELRTLTFQVKFVDGAEVDKPYSEIRKTKALEEYIKKHKELLPLTKETPVDQRLLKKQIKGQAIEDKYLTSKEVLIDTRCRVIFPDTWYAEEIEPIEDSGTHLYLMRATLGKTTAKGIKAVLQADREFLKRPKQVPLDNWDFHTYIYLDSELEPGTYTVVTGPTIERANLTMDSHDDSKVHSPERRNDNEVTILLLNVCSLRAAWKKGLPKYLTTKPHDVLVLTETRLPPDGWTQTQQAFKTLGYSHVFKTSTKTHRNENGVLIATNRFQPESHCMEAIEQPISEEKDGRILELTLQRPPITFVAAYLPCYNTDVQGRDKYAPRYMRAFVSKYVDALKSARERKRAIIICADLQVAITDLDQTENAVVEGSGSTTAERQALKDLFGDNRYADLYREVHPDGRETTSTASHEQWTGLPNGKEEVGKRIDYILGSSEIEALTYHIDQTPLTDHITDHAAVIATVRYHPVYPPCIEEYLRQNPNPKVHFKNTGKTK